MKLRSNPLLCCSITLCSVLSSHAASGTWDWSTSGTWHDGTNWSSDAIPNAAGDIATFDSSSGNTTISIGSTATTVKDILFNTSSAAAYTFTSTSLTNGG